MMKGDLQNFDRMQYIYLYITYFFLLSFIKIDLDPQNVNNVCVYADVG